MKKILGLFAVVLFFLSTTPAFAAGYTVIKPCRILDTRISGVPPAVLSAPLAANTAYPFNMLNKGCIPTPNGVPPITAVAINISVVNTYSANGFFVVWENYTPYPGTSNITFSASTPEISNSAIVAVAKDDTIQFGFGGSAGAKIDVVIDVVGYFQ